MSTEMNIDDLLNLPEDLIERAWKAVEERRLERYRAKAETTDQRIEKALRGNGDFQPLELHYAGTMRCVCGHGMAYPEGIGGMGAWYCSAILKGVADRNVEHSPSHPFAFWSIKSEDQCYRTGGRSTRPADEPLRDLTKAELARWGDTPPARVMPTIELGDQFRQYLGLPPRATGVEPVDGGQQ